ncbi:hypothetical protein C8R45DRAFT_569417 [Mycena sanguinolenta]|nr:hypothetical protein C8R45DRAFT_569417 [Mycena sanguinolenta]
MRRIQILPRRRLARHRVFSHRTKHKTNPISDTLIFECEFGIQTTLVSEIMPLPAKCATRGRCSHDRHTDQRSGRNIRFNYNVRIVLRSFAGIVAGSTGQEARAISFLVIGRLAMASNVQHRLRGPPVPCVRRAFRPVHQCVALVPALICIMN